MRWCGAPRDCNEPSGDHPPCHPHLMRTTDQVWDDFDLVRSAAEYATDVHRADYRKGPVPIPYVSHLWSVAALCLEYGGDDHQTAAALLHDAVEDGGGVARLEDIRARFGPEVARLVAALSDSVVDTTAGEQKPPWASRKRSYLAHLAEADERVALVSACDKLHNSRSILADYRRVGPDLWGRFAVSDPAGQLWYYGSLVDTLVPLVPGDLGAELRRTLDAILELVRGDEPDIDARVSDWDAT